jgi:hypothetical protein
MIDFIFQKLILRRNPYITLLFIFLNVVYYIYICSVPNFSIQEFFYGPNYKSLVLHGAKENGLIAAGQIHRFFFPSSCMPI